MDGGDTAQLLYMGLLIVAIGGSYLVSQRRNLGKTLQQAAIWILIILGAIAGVGLWEDISGTVTQAQNTNAAGQIEVPRRADGHFYFAILVIVWVNLVLHGTVEPLYEQTVCTLSILRVLPSSPNSDANRLP